MTVIISKERERLLDSYLAARHRIKNFAALTLIIDDFSSAKRVVENPMGLEHGDFVEVLRDLWIGYFDSLIDRSKGATNAPSIWKALFPNKAQRIEQWEQDSQPYLRILRRYRSERCFHANESLVEQIATWREYQNVKNDITKLMHRFLDIATEIVAEENTLDGLAARLEACCQQLNRLPGAAFTPDSLAKYIFGAAAFHISS